VLTACAALACGSAPSSARAQGAPSNAADAGGSFVGAPSPRAGEEPAERPWNASLRAFLEYDSNVGLTEEQAPAPYEYEPAFRAGLTGAGSYRWIAAERLTLGAGGYFAQTLTTGDAFADEYDLSSLAPHAWAALSLGRAESPARVQLAYQFRRDWLEGGDFERSHNARLSASKRFGAAFEGEVHYTYALEDFDARGFHALDARRDADHHRIGISGSWLRAESLQSLTLGYEYLRNVAELSDFDFEGHAISARFRTAIPAPWLIGLELFASYTDADYDHYPTTPRREARTQLYRSRLFLPLSRHWLLDATYSHLSIGADQARFRSKRDAVSAGLSYQF